MNRLGNKALPDHLVECHPQDRHKNVCLKSSTTKWGGGPPKGIRRVLRVARKDDLRQSPFLSAVPTETLGPAWKGLKRLEKIKVPVGVSLDLALLVGNPRWYNEKLFYPPFPKSSHNSTMAVGSGDMGPPLSLPRSL